MRPGVLVSAVAVDLLLRNGFVAERRPRILHETFDVPPAAAAASRFSVGRLVRGARRDSARTRSAGEGRQRVHRRQYLHRRFGHPRSDHSRIRTVSPIRRGASGRERLAALGLFETGPDRPRIMVIEDEESDFKDIVVIVNEKATTYWGDATGRRLRRTALHLDAALETRLVRSEMAVCGSRTRVNRRLAEPASQAPSIVRFVRPIMARASVVHIPRAGRNGSQGLR